MAICWWRASPAQRGAHECDPCRRKWPAASPRAGNSLAKGVGMPAIASLGGAKSMAEHMGEPLRAGIIGYGLAGSVFHAPLVASTPVMRVAAIVTGDPDRQAQARRDYPEARL